MPGVPVCVGCEQPLGEGHACAPLIVDAVRAALGGGVEVLDYKGATDDERDAFFARKHAPPLREALILASVAAGGVDAVPLDMHHRRALLAADRGDGYSIAGDRRRDLAGLRLIAFCDADYRFTLTGDGRAALASGAVALTAEERAEVAKRLGRKG